MLGYGDGDESYTLNRRETIDNNHSLLAWRGTPTNKRGFSESGNWPTGSCSAQGSSLAKICMSHHGAAGGTYPAAPAGPDVWTAPAAANWIEDCATDPPGGPLTPDPGPDNATNPSVDYTSFNGGLRIYALHHLGTYCSRVVTYGYPHPFTRAVSSEPNDGANFCQCLNCRDILRSGPYSAYLTPAQQTQDASDSDKNYHWLNETQKYFQHHFQNATFVPRSGILAYVSHVDPPNIPIHQNSLTVVLYASSLNARTLPSELIEQWLAKRSANPWGQFMLGISPQWLTDNTNFAAPKWPSPAIGAAYFGQWVNSGYVTANAQTGGSSITMGLLLGAMSEQCWDPSFSASADIDLFFSVLGPAGPAVRIMFERWWQWFEHSPHEVAVMVRDCAAAQTALDAAPDASLVYRRVDIQARLDQVKMFVEWQRRYTEYLPTLAAFDGGRLTSAGPGSIPAVTLTPFRTAPSIVRIECTLGGINGTAQFRWTKNADAATIVWEQSVQTIPTTPFTFTLGTTGRVATFPNSTYTVGQSWDETPNIAPLVAAVGRCLEWCWLTSAKNVIHSYRLADKLTLRAPHPFSNSKSGTAPPNLTVQSTTGAGGSPVAALTYIEVECTTGGTIGAGAAVRWRANGGAWTTVAVTTSLAFTGTGVVVTCQNTAYSTDNRWYMTFDINLSKWNVDDVAAPANGPGWGAIVPPSSAALTALIADGIATYTPVAGVTRRAFNESSFQAFNPSVATTLRAGPKFSTPHAYVLRKPAGTVTIKLNSTGTSATIGQQVRVVLQDLAGVALQTWLFTPAASPTTVISDIVITQAAGNYQLVVIDCASTNTLSWLSTPENVAIVLVNNWLDAVAATTRGFSLSDRQYFYVPAGETKVVMVFAQGVGVGVLPVQFYNPSGTPVTTTFTAPNQWVCDVPSGQDNAAWSFTGYYPIDNISPVFFENCPARLAPSAAQLLIN